MKNVILLVGSLATMVVFGAVYDVRSFGAKGDGTAKDTAAVQRALDACAKTGGRVVVPAGSYLIGSIYLGDNTELHLEEGATLLGSPDLADYNEPDAYPQNWGSPREGWSAKHLILAIEKQNVSLTGKGVIDGNGRAFFDPKPRYRSKICWRHGGCNAKGERSEQRRPGQEIVFVECRNVAVRDVMFKDMSCWSCLFHGCDGVVVGGVRVRNGFLNVNTDGFDIDSCSNVSIGDCDIVTGDDAIAIRGSPARLKKPEKVCEDVRVSNIVCRVQADGVRVGVGNGTIRNVRIADMKVLEAGRALHVQCCYGNPKAGEKVGVDISDVVFERIDIKDACEPIAVMAGSAASTAHLKDIAFREIRAESTLPPSIVGKGKTRPCNISFADCSFLVGKTVPGSQADDKFDLNAGGGKGAFVVDQADGVSVKNCSVRLFDTGEEVPALTAKPHRMRAICKQGYHHPEGEKLPGNSLEAFKYGWTKGVKLIETDCWMIKGGRIICVHDSKVLKGQCGELYNIRNLTEADVARIDIGKKLRTKDPVRMPYLEDIFATMPKDAIAQCELCGYTPTFADTFDAMRIKAGLSVTNFVLSGGREPLLDFKRRYPEYRTLWLYSKFFDLVKDEKEFTAWLKKTHSEGISILCPRGVTAMKYGFSLADADRVRAAGLEFRIWGVNSPELLAYARDLKVPAATCARWQNVFEWAKVLPGIEVTP